MTLSVSSVFTYSEDLPRLSVDEEVTLIERAQAGDEDAFMTLLASYGPIIRHTIASSAKIADPEDIQGEALAAFNEVLKSHDPHDPAYANGRLASRLPDHLLDRLRHVEAQVASTFSIPKRTHTRYLAVLNRADGDLQEALELAPSMGMKSSTFLEIFLKSREATRTALVSEDDEEFEGRVRSVLNIEGDSTYDEVEDRLMIDVAFAALDDSEARVIELAYGFRSTFDYASGEPVPDSAIALIVGGSRATIQRRRGKALAKCREALGVTLVVRD